jgi:hypothetical protein
MTELERNIAQNSNVSLQALNANHVLRALVRQVPLLVTQAANRDDCALLFSQNIVRQLYNSDNKLATEINLLILEKLCEISKRFFKELKEWFLYDDNEVYLFNIKFKEKVRCLSNYIIPGAGISYNPRVRFAVIPFDRGG